MSSSQHAISATYSAPAEQSETFRINMPPCSPDSSTEDRTKYLGDLRTSISQIQGQVNEFLTQKMEKDKTAAGTEAANETKEEENYGEEVPEDT